MLRLPMYRSHQLQPEGTAPVERHVVRRLGSQETAPEADPSGARQNPLLQGTEPPIPLDPTARMQQYCDQAVAGLRSTFEAKLEESQAQVAKVVQENVALHARIAALEGEQLHKEQPVQELKAQVEDLKVQLTAAKTDLHGRMERADLQDRATCMVIFGLKEQNGEQVHDSATQELVNGARAAGFKPDAVVEVTRLGPPREDQDRPRPAMVRCRTVADKHRAFKGRSALRERGLRLDDCLTPGQIQARRALMPAMEELRKQPNANPHFRGSRLMYWKGGRALQYRPSAGRDTPQQQPQPSPAPAPPASGQHQGVAFHAGRAARDAAAPAKKSRARKRAAPSENLPPPPSPRPDGGPSRSAHA